MLLKITQKKPHHQTPSQLIATSSLSSYWDKPHKYSQKAKQKKAAPEGYFVWFHATMLFCGLFSGLLLNLLTNKF